MSTKIAKADVFVVDVVNRPGMLARVLEALHNAGANLEFVVARRVNDDTSRVFLAPIKGAKQTRAAGDVGLRRAEGMHAIRVESPDRPGLGSRMTRAVAAAGLNIRGLSAASLGKRSVCYLAFATAEDAALAGKAIKKALSGKGK